MNISKFFNALKWSVAGELASKAIQPIVFIILARILTPDDYGIVAAAIMVISFTQIFWEAGMSKALIQKQTNVEASANIAFWCNCGMSIIISLLLFLFSNLISTNLFHDERVASVLKLMTIQIVLGAISSVHTALLQKEMKFNRLFWVRITTVAIPGIFSIPLALHGWSYWSIITGTLVGQAAQVIILWRICKWRPEFGFNAPLAKQLGKFGAWVSLSGLLSWFYIWIDSFFVGSYLGTYQLGLYRTGNQFVDMIYGFLFAPLLPVLYSHFSGVHLNVERLRNIFFKVVRVITLISIPLAFIIYALKNPLSFVFFGEKWNGVGFIIGIMALKHGYSWVSGVNGEVYRAIGKPSYETVVTSLTLLIYLTGYFISINYGFTAFVWTRFFFSIRSYVYPYLFWVAFCQFINNQIT